MSQKYDKPAIERAFRHHAIHGEPDFSYRGLTDEQPPRWHVVVRGEHMRLTNREAWILSFGLAAGRECGKRVAQIVADENL